MEDCIIIGAGPAGLTAAIYLARFHLSIRLFDDGSSRAALIPRTHNHAGYPRRHFRARTCSPGCSTRPRASAPIASWRR